MSLPAAAILGIGAITPLGRDLEKIAARLAEPAVKEMPLRVADELLADARIAKRMRRADRFPRMAAIAALDAWTNAGGGDGLRVGVIVATGFGPHARTFKFLDGILDCGDSSALPTDFSHSVHNAAGAYITEMLDLRGRSCTIADFETGFEQAVLLAQCWLAEGACERVLVGAVDELGEGMLKILPRMSLAPEITPGEGAVFLLLGPSAAGGLTRIDADMVADHADLMLRDEPELVPGTESVGRVASVSDYFGHSSSSTAFAVLAGVLALRGGRVLGRTIHNATAGPVDSVVTCKRLSNGQAARLLLTRSGV